MRLIREDEILAEMRSERCHHFTKGECAACKREELAGNISKEMDELESELEAEYNKNGLSQRWHELNDRLCDASLDLSELSHP